ncbi:MAG: GNAT family N-acetyltransferase, partial [Pseudomonadota bacterium]
MDSFQIRPANPGDVGSLHQMLLELATEVDRSESISSSPDDLLHHGFGKNRRFDTLVIESSHQLVGFCLFFLTFSSWRGETGVYIQDLYVAPHTRKENLGKRLLEAAALKAQDDGATHLRLSLHTENQKAAEFYQHVGLLPQQHERIFEIN